MQVLKLIYPGFVLDQKLKHYMVKKNDRTIETYLKLMCFNYKFRFLTILYSKLPNYYSLFAFTRIKRYNKYNT